MKCHLRQLPLFERSNRQLGRTKGHRSPGLHFDENQRVLLSGNDVHLTQVADIILFDYAVAFLLQESKGLFFPLFPKVLLLPSWFASVLRVRNKSPSCHPELVSGSRIYTWNLYLNLRYSVLRNPKSEMSLLSPRLRALDLCVIG